MHFHADNNKHEPYRNILAMYFKASNSPKYNSTIQTLQIKLNAIKIDTHGNWPQLATDGLFGNKTKEAVKSFQIYRGITPASGEIGDTTIKYINEVFNHILISKASHNKYNTTRNSSATYIWDISAQIIGQLSNTLKNVSDSIIKQIKYYKSQKITANDIERLMKSIFQRPDVENMRNLIKKDVYEYFEKTAKGNTNVINYKKSQQTYRKLEQIRNAQKQLSKGFDAQTKSNIEKRVAQQLLEKVISELESANFSNKITETLKKCKINHIKGGGVLALLSFTPMIYHAYILVEAMYTGKSKSEPLKALASDIISMIEGALIGAIVAAVIMAIGVTGGIAVLAILAVSVIVGVIIEVLFPDHSKWLAEKMIIATKNICNKMSSTPEPLIIQKTN